MKMGMLWFDDTQDQTLSAKIERAATYYREKYGDSPNVCYVHPSFLARENSSKQVIKVLGARDILPHHFWLGVVEARDKQKEHAIDSATE